MILATILLADEEYQSQPLSPQILENVESFKRLHPGLEHRLFRNVETRDFIAGEYGGEILAVYDILKPYSYKSDLARHCIMFKHGGVYADLSVYFLQNWRPRSGKLGVFRDFLYAAPWQVATTVYCAPPGHKAVGRAIELICDNVRNRYYGKTFLCPTGPTSFGKAIANSCDGDDLVSGDSVWVTDTAGHPGLITEASHGFVCGDHLVAVKRKRRGAPLSEIGVRGSNEYRQMWQRRDIYAVP
jgi:hypothetical protein